MSVFKLFFTMKKIDDEQQQHRCLIDFNFNNKSKSKLYNTFKLLNNSSSNFTESTTSVNSCSCSANYEKCLKIIYFYGPVRVMCVAYLYVISIYMDSTFEMRRLKVDYESIIQLIHLNIKDQEIHTHSQELQQQHVTTPSIHTPSQTQFHADQQCSSTASLDNNTDNSAKLLIFWKYKRNHLIKIFDDCDDNFFTIDYQPFTPVNLTDINKIEQNFIQFQIKQDILHELYRQNVFTNTSLIQTHKFIKLTKEILKLTQTTSLKGFLYQDIIFNLYLENSKIFFTITSSNSGRNQKSHHQRAAAAAHNTSSTFPAATTSRCCHHAYHTVVEFPIVNIVVYKSNDELKQIAETIKQNIFTSQAASTTSMASSLQSSGISSSSSLPSICTSNYRHLDINIFNRNNLLILPLKSNELGNNFYYYANNCLYVIQMTVIQKVNLNQKLKFLSKLFHKQDGVLSTLWRFIYGNSLKFQLVFISYENRRDLYDKIEKNIFYQSVFNNTNYFMSFEDFKCHLNNFSEMQQFFENIDNI